MTADRIETAEALDALPVGSVVSASEMVAALRGFYGDRDTWYATNGGRYSSSALLHRHGAVALLYRPDVPAAGPPVTREVIMAAVSAVNALAWDQQRGGVDPSTPEIVNAVLAALGVIVVDGEATP